VKDELEYATNWQRAFLNLFTRLKWLNAFAQINYIALQKSLKKFMKAYFELEDNVIDKQIQKYINDQTFTSKKNVKNVIEQIIECYAENFTNGNKETARRVLLNENVQIRQKDAMLLCFFSGTLLITLLVTIGTILMPVENVKPLGEDYFDWDELILTVPVFRFVFMMIFALILISVDVYILRKYRVNYMFIFDLDPNYKVTHVQLFRVSMMLLTIWMLCFMA
jgi:hypothetical protein